MGLFDDLEGYMAISIVQITQFNCYASKLTIPIDLIRRQSESQLNGRRRHMSGTRHDRSHLNSFDFEPTSPAWDDYIDAEGEELFDADVQMSLSNAVLMDDGELINIANRSGQGCVIVTGLFCGRPIRCEVPFDISTLLSGEWRGPTEEDDAWEETIHQLAAGSLLMDYDIQSMGQIMDDGKIEEGVRWNTRRED